VAFMSKYNILMTGKNLEYFHSLHENIRVKSGAWDEHGVFVYSTLSHVKYCLPNGDNGIIHSLQTPIYIIRVNKQFMHYIDRENVVQKQRLNCTEYLFKLALHNRKFNDVKMWITNGRLCGNVVIGYLKQKGFPEVALHFVEDQQTRFNLALEYGHIEEAMTAAQELDDVSCWNRLGLEALRQGQQQVVEMVYQKTKNFDALSFLYMITGNVSKLKKMSLIAERLNDVMMRFHNALLLGNVEERVKIMAEMGQVPLAALTAKAHALVEYIPKLDEQLQGNDISSHIPTDARLLLPPVPLHRPTAGDSNWPLLKSMKQLFEEKKFENVPVPTTNFQSFVDQEEESPEDLGGGVDWQEEQDGIADVVEGAWGGDMDIDLPDIPGDLVVEEKSSTITVGDSCQTKWLKRRKLVADLVAAGEFDEALNALKRRLGVVNVDPLEPLFKEAYWATCSSYTGFPDAPSLQFPLLAEGSGKGRDCAPIILFNSESIVERVKEANRLTTQGRFKDALAVYRAVLQSIPLSVAADATEEQNLLGMVETCREYVGAMRLETTRQSFDAAEQSARKVELSAYLACCKLQPVHLMLTLRVAMTTSFKAGNFVTAASFAKRLIQGNFGSVQKPADVVTQAKKVLQVCDVKATEAFEINFDPKAPVEDFKLCCGSLTPISATDPSVQCPYCSAEYHVSYRGTVCQTCELSEIGAKTLGLQLRPI